MDLVMAYLLDYIGIGLNYRKVMCNPIHNKCWQSQFEKAMTAQAIRNVEESQFVTFSDLLAYNLLMIAAFQ